MEPRGQWLKKDHATEFWLDGNELSVFLKEYVLPSSKNINFTMKTIHKYATHLIYLKKYRERLCDL
jgi:hypothetical protein